MNKNDKQKRVFTSNKITENIDFLFDDLWPQMHSRETARGSCYDNLVTIVEKFNKFQTDFNLLLASLTALDGLGLVISTGLIFAAYPNSAVPFDKYTMGFALFNKILSTSKISNNQYIVACYNVLNFIENHITINSIHDFVLAANCLDRMLAKDPM